MSSRSLLLLLSLTTIMYLLMAIHGIVEGFSVKLARAMYLHTKYVIKALLNYTTKW
ncbi:MAG: hypothetical protein LM590_15335 [Thermofilum sp.]|nr:hypothetical protein [Thermofilum sp.]